jgi:hypothetical protein
VPSCCVTRNCSGVTAILSRELLRALRLANVVARNLHGQGPRAEAVRRDGCNARAAKGSARVMSAGVPPTTLFNDRGGSAAGPKPGRDSFTCKLGGA